MLPSLAASSLVLAAAVAQDPLAELLQRASAVPHVSAEYTMTTALSPEPATISFDYIAPGSMRVLRRGSDGSFGMWCIDGVMSTRFEGETSHAGEFDIRQLAAESKAVASRVRAILPELSEKAAGEADAEKANATWRITWGFDTAAGEARFNQGVGARLRSPAPFGWLDTLREKRAVLVAVDDGWKATTDARFEVVVDAATGLLRSFRGRGAKGEMAIELVRADFTTPPPAERFVVPPRPDGALDGGDEVGMASRRASEEGLRMRILAVIASAKGPLAGDAAARAAGETRAQLALREFCAATMQRAFDQMVAMVGKRRGPLVQKIVAERDAGKSAEVVATLRSMAAKSIAEALAPQAKELVRRAPMPPEVAALPFAADALAAERTVVEQLFRERVVDVAVAAFQKACDEALK